MRFGSGSSLPLPIVFKSCQSCQDRPTLIRMQRIELKGLSPQQIDQLLPEGLISLCWRGSVADGMYVPKSDCADLIRVYLPVRRWCAAYASFLRLILSLRRSARDEPSSMSAAVSSLTSGAAAQGNASVAPQALASTDCAPA